ncbi:MAG TPA: DNA/RNA non-specific endonuclease, partial [Acidimicrobiia bacterium]
MRRAAVWAVVSAFAALGLQSSDAHADSTPQTLPFSQNWTNAGQITTDDNWNGVPGIIGYRGDGLTGSTGTDPRTILVDGTNTPIDVNANQTNPNTFTTGGVAEFAIANPTVALQGSGTAAAPFLLISLNTLGHSSITVSYNLRDIDGSTDNAIQPVALQYRVGNTGNFTNVPAGYIADATTGPSLTTLVTPVNVTLPCDANNQPLVQLRVMTTNAVGNDEWVGIDDISINGTVGATTNPCGTGSANPTSVGVGDTSLLTVSVTPGTNPPSTGIQVSADLSSIGGSSAQAFASGGGNTFTFQATVLPGTTAGPKTLPVTIPDAEGRTGATSINLTVLPPPPPVGHPVISQVYGGGGNTNAVFQNDYVELYNPGTATVDLTGWSVQYASESGTFSPLNVQPLAGPIAPGEYYLVGLASGGPVGAELPVLPNISGTINMSATTGKVALVRNGDALTGAVLACPTDDPDLIDLLGYGGANCREGSVNAPAPSNTTALLRKNGGLLDTDHNNTDFAVGTPNPRRTAPIVEVGPFVQSSDPFPNGTNVPRDASVTVTFSEDVSVDPGWFGIVCATTGAHDGVNDFTLAGGPRTFVITPNTNFLAGEQCTVTLHKDSVHDLDLDDAGPNTDTLPADKVWTFRIAADTPAPYPPEVHLTMGNPSGATADINTPNNYLMEKPEFALSYNRDLGRPNWVSWHLDTSWFGTLTRVDTFRPDPAVPPDWYRVQATDFFSTGFDRGHMTPNADRDSFDSIVQATFLMSNMVAQAPDNNQGPWANLENYLRTLATAGDEIYIVSGPAGTGGTGSNGFASTLAGGHVAVPAYTWKAALVLPKDAGDDVSRVTASTRTIAVIMPNTQGIRSTPNNPNDWQNYLTTVDAVETLTGYDLFSNVEEAVQNAIEAGLNGVNPPGVANQLVTDNEDAQTTFTLRAVSPGGPLTYFIDSAPAHGAVTGSGGTLTYAPVADFAGTDTFTFHVSDGAHTSNTGTVTIRVLEVNDPPTAGDDAKSTDEDVPLVFAAADLTANDSAGPANEAGQTLTVASVGNATHGTVQLAGGQVTFTPAPDFNGTATFTYQVCDDGLSSGIADPKCATGTVTVAVAPVNDPPVFTFGPAPASTPEGSAYGFTALATDVDGQALTFSLVGAPAGAAINPATGQFSWTPTEAQGGTGVPFAFKVRVSDGIANTDADVVVDVTEVNVAPTLTVAGHFVVPYAQTLSFTAVGSDADLPAQALTYSLAGAVPAGAAIDPVSGALAWTPTPAQVGSYGFNVSVSDGLLSASTLVTIDVLDSTPPTLAVPGDITIEATGAATPVSFSASATDVVDGPITPVCTPASGSPFAVGTVTVGCTATDAHGNIARGSFAVTVTDHTPPALSLPGNLTAVATTPAGAVVTFAASASDLVDGTRPIVCAPASGGTFAISVTTVACSASDAHGSTANGSFTVTVTTDTVPGRMVGNAEIDLGSVEHAFEFLVQERSSGADAGLVAYRVRTRNHGRDQEDRFESATVTSVSFFNVPGVSPGHKPPSGIDTVSFAGVGRWNGRAGYTFDAVAVDAGEPGRNRDSFRITVRDATGQAVASV